MADNTNIIDMLPAALGMIGVGANLYGGATSYEGAYAAGDAAKLAGERQRAVDEFLAAQLEQKAKTSIATGQRAAIEQKRQGDLNQSRIIALAAASGGGTGGSVANIVARSAGQTAYNMNTMLYQGEEQARQQMLDAAAKRHEGFLATESGAAQQKAWEIAGRTAAQKAGVNAFTNGAGAAAALIKGASSLYNNYGAGGALSANEKVVDASDNWNESLMKYPVQEVIPVSMPDINWDIDFGI